ncbi:type II secretion system F family protein [Nocardioides aequoreus]|uniref:type II secretion system F family protein n=1 Tax=Nocardioides aequoreus TaxID=397278 RepID=UPI000A01DC4D|nr:type II secretion system F family protein [Nocardioides aequoreus]
MTRPSHRPALRRAVAATSLGVLLALATAAPTLAADSAEPSGATIDHAQPGDGRVQLLVSLPSGDVDPDAVEVSIGGKSVEARTTTASADAQVRRTSVLAIDTSLSMRGARIEAARTAALSYLTAVPADVEVGLVTFDDDVTVALEPTRDRDAARRALGDLRLQRETALYDGIAGAVEAAGPGSAEAGQRSVLVLSDGQDTTSTPLSETLRRVEESGVLLDVISLQQQGQAALPLRLLADAGRGAVLDASRPEALDAAFRAQAQALARQVVVTAEVPEGAGTSADVEVRLPSGDATLTAAAHLPVRGGVDEREEQAATASSSGIPGPVTPSFEVSQLVAYGAIAAIGLGVLGAFVTLGLVRKGPDRDDKLRQQLEAYGVFGPTAAAQAAPEPGGATIGQQAKDAAEKVLAGQAGLETRIAARLEGAGVALKPSEWLLAHAGIAIAAGALGLLLGGGSILLLLLGVVLGLVGPWVFLGLKKARRLKAFAETLPDTLQLMSGSLSAGLSLAQSIDTIVREAADPIASEFRRVVVEGRIGIPFEEALDGVAHRMESRDFEWVVMAIRIQREVGGNLAELLLQVAATLREREFLRRHVRALSAEGRLSAWVLGGLPPAFMLYLLVSRPEYVAPMYTTPLGLVMLCGGGLLMAVGMFWMFKVAKVEL